MHTQCPHSAMQAHAVPVLWDGHPPWLWCCILWFYFISTVHPQYPQRNYLPVKAFQGPTMEDSLVPGCTLCAVLCIYLPPRSHVLLCRRPFFSPARHRTACAESKSQLASRGNFNAAPLCAVLITAFKNTCVSPRTKKKSQRKSTKKFRISEIQEEI